MNANTKPANWPLGLIGAVVGGIVGYFVFFLLSSQGLYAVVLVSAAPGLGGGLLLRGKSIGLGVACGFIGVLLGLFTEWRFAPFIADPSFTYFIHNLQITTLILIAIGGLLGFWFGMGREVDNRKEGE
ncbi:MAG: hypothetical protein ABSE63_10135 [Thermoguttaceae bacterium]|jgi:uncharacterized membrane protein (UPF0136 family)